MVAPITTLTLQRRKGDRGELKSRPVRETTQPSSLSSRDGNAGSTLTQTQCLCGEGLAPSRCLLMAAADSTVIASHSDLLLA